MPSISSTLSALAAVAIQIVSAKDWDSPAYTALYQYPLPIPPVKKPLQ
jgi:bilirubin oxidase